MRRFALVISIVAAAAAFAAPVFAQGKADPAQLSVNHTGSTLIMLPMGIAVVKSGDMTLLPSSHTGVHLLFAGEARAVLKDLPKNDALNLFAESGQTNEKGELEFQVAGMYMKCGTGSGAAFPSMKLTGEGVDPSSDMWGYYIQSWSDAFPVEMTDEEMMAAMTGGGVPAGPAVREPDDGEFFIAIFTKDGRRFDYSRDKSGKTTIVDYRESFTYYEHPYFVAEEDYDPRLDFGEKTVYYSFDPSSKQMFATVLMRAEALESMHEYPFYCYPWAEVSYAEIDGASAEFERVSAGGEPTWRVNVKAEFKKGSSHQIYFEFSAQVPDSYDSIGYGGVYRFDDYIVYTADDACDKLVQAELPEGTTWSIIAGPGGGVDQHTANTLSAKWSASNRGVMLVATQFPMREIQSGSVTLEVYAPQDIIDSVHENPAVAQLGQMLDYFGSEFGVYSRMFPGGKIERQQLFIIPDEGGVAAFENAGLLFYLGSDNSLPLVAHEVSHIWWGHMVDGPVWFVEGMANYCPIAYLEEFEPERAANYRRYIMGTAVSRAKPISLGRRSELGDSSARYQYSAGLFVTLATMCGKEKFHAALKKLSRDFTDKEPLTIDTLMRSLGDSLSGTKFNAEDFRKNFYDETLAYGVSGGWEPIPGIAPDKAVRIWISRDPAVEGWLPVPVRVALADGRTIDAVCDTRSADSTMRLDVTAEPVSITLDPDNELLVVTPERANYIEFLGWLTPAWMKRGMGDTEGAIYCFEHALVFRRWARDLKDLAELYFKAGRTDDAWKLVNEIIDAGNSGAQIGGRAVETDALARTYWLAGKMTEAAGDKDGAKSYYEKALELAKQSGLYDLVKAAQEKLGIEPEEGAAPPRGMMGMGG
ncbi:MAG: hypothetical protein HRF49_01190 [bacterium]|jgi:hypothetical protein